MMLLHYYVQKGWKIDDFLQEPKGHRLFYLASMIKRAEEFEDIDQ